MGLLLILAAADSPLRAELLALARVRGDEAIAVGSRRELEERLRELRPAAVLADHGLLGETPGPEGERGESLPFVLLARPEEAEAAALHAEAAGAELLLSPVSAPALSLCLCRLARWRSLRGERDELRAGSAAGTREVLAGSSAAAVRLREIVDRVAGTPRSTVLVTGEVGVEKGLVARAIHERSSRAAGPFRILDVAREEPARLRALLRGGEDREGVLAQAAGGTLHLAEVAGLPPSAQDLLTDLLREESFLSGGGAPRALDARIVASTRFDLEARTAAGLFRGDLFYRLNVLTVPVPPLRERREDLPELVRLVLRRLPVAAPGGIPSLSAAAWRRLAEHDWPGNLRELRATLERAAFAARGGEIQPGHLGLDLPPAGADSPGGAGGSDRSLRAMEERLIRRVLAEEGGNRSRTARVLGINRSTLYHKLRQFGIR
ncbi:MAG: sigma 54-interacting transcriptional regulator [Planctomycetota bacterium]